ncbi:MAG: 30S ribosomal protein S20 [Myxococcota bacterium]
MATHKQAQKRHRQSEDRAERNRYYEATLRSMLKGARAAIAQGQKAAAETVKTALAYVDHVAGKGVIPRGRADRLKSRIASQAAKQA